MGEIADFLDMGGYGSYVWPAYALAAVVLVGLVIHSIRSLRAHELSVRALEGEAPHRRGRSGTEGRT